MLSVNRRFKARSGFGQMGRDCTRIPTLVKLKAGCISHLVSYTNLLSSCPYSASHQGGMRNEEQTYLKRLILLPCGLPLMRWLRLCLRRAATDFFSTAKKSRQKMPLSCTERLAQRKSLL